MRVGRNNTKGVECCKDVLQVARSGQISLLRLNVLALQKYTRLFKSGEVLHMKNAIMLKAGERWSHNHFLRKAMH